MVTRYVIKTPLDFKQLFYFIRANMFLSTNLKLQISHFFWFPIKYYTRDQPKQKKDFVNYHIFFVRNYSEKRHFLMSLSPYPRLIRTNCRWNPSALLIVEGGVDDWAVVETSLAGDRVGGGQGVLAPVFAHRFLCLALQRLLVVVFVKAVREVLSETKISI